MLGDSSFPRYFVLSQDSCSYHRVLVPDIGIMILSQELGSCDRALLLSSVSLIFLIVVLHFVTIFRVRSEDFVSPRMPGCP